MIAGRYSLDREIGRGGMGAVWLGRDEVLGRPVAMKRVGMAPGGSAADLERAEREARLAARLNHPHVVAVFDLVTEDDQRWLVMEHVPGTTLAELVRTRGPLAPDEAAAVLAQAADALAAAHAAGIVHRDVKPSNMLVTTEGRVKLSDFGIARAEADASLTRTGLVTGSPAYLAPEVASGRVAGAPSDVWALGASLFHALAGHPPYDVGENLLGALYRIVHEEPPRLAEAGWLSPLLEATMCQDPAGRWTMGQVRDFLEAGPRGAAPRPVPVAHATSDEHDTQVLTRPPILAPPPPLSGLAGASAPPSRPHRARRRAGPGALVLAAVLVVGAAVAAFAVGLADRDGESPSAAPSGGATSSPSATTTSAPPPTDRGIDAFVRDYLQTAARDPSGGYAMLTPAYQRASRGLAGYTGFWGGVRSIDAIESVEPDADDLEVRYVYRYTLDNGESRREDVRLRLAYADGTYRIAGDA